MHRLILNVLCFFVESGNLSIKKMFYFPKRYQLSLLKMLSTSASFSAYACIECSNEILGWEGVGNRNCCAFLKRRLIAAC
jgi:hypothetical protein